MDQTHDNKINERYKKCKTKEVGQIIPLLQVVLYLPPCRKGLLYQIHCASGTMKSNLKAMRTQARYLRLNVNFPKKPNSTGVRK